MRSVTKSIPIKKLMLVVEMSLTEGKHVHPARFMTRCRRPASSTDGAPPTLAAASSTTRGPVIGRRPQRHSAPHGHLHPRCCHGRCVHTGSVFCICSLDRPTSRRIARRVRAEGSSEDDGESDWLVEEC